MSLRTHRFILVAALGGFILFLSMSNIFLLDANPALILSVPNAKSEDEIQPSQPPTEPLLQTHTYASPIIRKEGCIITVVLMEPTLNQGSFAALESVATNLHPLDRTCVLIQTSLCTLNHHSSLLESKTPYQLLTDSITQAARPLFRKMIQAGNVRVTIMNQTRYNHPSCSKFDANHAWMSYDYWGDYSHQGGEFVADIDSDFVLLMQADSVLCHGLHVPSWNHLTFVGAPWTPHAVSWWNPCRDLHENWKQMHGSNPVPPFPDSDALCNDPKRGPIGNGGLSLRSRQWMQRAIQYCPSSFSGLSSSSSPCSLSFKNGPPEDVYFSTILLGLDHNPSLLLAMNDTNVSILNSTSSSKSKSKPLQLATMYEAGLFSSESLVLSHLLTHYNQSSTLDMMNLIQKYWWDGKYNEREIQMLNLSKTAIQQVENGLQKYQRMKKLELESSGTKPIIPIGFHKAWQFFKMDGHIFHECPLYRDQLSSEEIEKFN
jgi:hypothetical protein